MQPADLEDMADLAFWIAGLMAENTNEVGFIPIPTIESQYVEKSRFILQNDERGCRVGYILHGPLSWGQPVYISQHCIQYEKRLCGYGRMAFDELLRRVNIAGSSSILLRCAEDLPAVLFWQSCGFSVYRVDAPNNRRQRLILNMAYNLHLPLENIWKR